MKPSYEELEEQLNRSRRLCDAALANERAWETAMMQACGEDGPKSVADKFAELEQKLIESERYGRQTDITIDNLEMKLAQMAAELASVKQQEPKAWFIRITDEVTVDAREGEKWRGVPLVRVDVETPNHDAILAEVRAQGVEMVIAAKKHQKGIMHTDTFGYGAAQESLRNLINELELFAAQLRQQDAQ